MIPWPSPQQVRYLMACPCQKNTGGYRPNDLYGGNKHAVTLLVVEPWVAWIDVGIVEDVQRRWSAGIPTFACCEDKRYVMFCKTEDVQRGAALLDWVTWMDDLSVHAKPPIRTRDQGPRDASAAGRARG